MFINNNNLLLKHKINNLNKFIAYEKLYKSRFGRTRFLSVRKPELNAMHDLLSIMKVQNELLHNANKKLKD